MVDFSHKERGAGKGGAIVGLIVLIIAIVVAWEWIPARVKVYKLKDHAEQMSRQMATGRLKPEKAKENLLKMARNEGLPVKEDDITITDDNRSWYIQLKYTLPLDFIVYQHEWSIDQKVEGVKIDV